MKMLLSLLSVWHQYVALFTVSHVFYVSEYAERTSVTSSSSVVSVQSVAATVCLGGAGMCISLITGAFSSHTHTHARYDTMATVPIRTLFVF